MIVSSVSCIYGLGSPDSYRDLKVHLYLNQNIARDELLKALVEIQYQRKDFDFHRGTFRVRGDRVEIFPSYEENIAFRIEFFGDYIDFIGRIDPIQGQCLRKSGSEFLSVYPCSHYVSTEKREINQAIKTIKSRS